MNPRSFSAFLLSATFHAAIVLALFVFGFVAGRDDKPPQRILELVAGEGDNFGATVAPKLGTPGGIKVDVPAVPLPKIAEPEPTPPPPQIKTEPTPPPEPVPTPPPPKPTPPPPKKPEPTVPNFSKQILRKTWAAEAKAKKEVAKERAAEEKRLKKEEFDRQQKAKVASATRGSAPKVAHIDGEGIAKGVIGGSSENKVGGAGGKALVADGALVDRYFALLVQRVKSALDKPPGLSDELVATVVFHIAANGRISNVRISKTSGSDEFDRALVAAFSRVSMPDHPEHKSEDVEIPFRTKEID